jgi:hypothetical protein
MLIAAVMGHLAGWILEFGDHPAILGRYAHFAGVPFATFRDNLIGSHSHEMAVASMALILAAAVYRFGYRDAAGVSRALSRTGMAMVAVGVVTMTAAYVAMAATSWAVPTLFQSANGTNGVAGDDILTGVLVMGGGLLAVWPIVGRALAPAHARFGRVFPLAAAWAWTGTVLGAVTLLLLGGGVWVFVNPALHGTGYLLSSLGMALRGISIATTVAAGLMGDRGLRLLPHRPHRRIHVAHG